MKAKVFVRLKNGVLDPQGTAVLHAAQTLGFEDIKDVRVGKIFELEVSGNNPQEINKRLATLSDQLLANTVIENYQIVVEES